MVHLKKLNPAAVERFDDLHQKVKSAVRTLNGRGAVSQFDRLELQPGFGELQKHLDHALRWADEMQLIISEELS